MKKVLLIFAVLVSMIAVSCGSSDSPKAVAETALAGMKSEDYKAVVAVMGNKEGKALTKEQQDNLVGMLQSKAKESGKIASYEITGETIAEDGKTAVVNYTVTYEGKEPKEDKMEMIKGEDGKWRWKQDK